MLKTYRRGPALWVGKEVRRGKKHSVRRITGVRTRFKVTLKTGSARAPLVRNSFPRYDYQTYRAWAATTTKTCHTTPYPQ